MFTRGEWSFPMVVRHMLFLKWLPGAQLLSRVLRSRLIQAAAQSLLSSDSWPVNAKPPAWRMGHAE